LQLFESFHKLQKIPKQANVGAELQTTRDLWKRRYFESKAKTVPLDTEVQDLKGQLEKCRDEILRQMKSKIVERTKQRQPGDVALRKRYFHSQH